MDIVEFLSSLNKIALVAFIFTLGFLVYEIILLRKSRGTQTKPEVPKFTEVGKLVISSRSNIEGAGKSLMKKPQFMLVVLSALLMIFGSVALLGYINLRSSKAIVDQPVPSPTIFIALSEEDPTPTTAPEAVETPTPTTTVTPTQIPEEETATPTLEVEETASPSPTLLTKLPQTGYITNLLILFSIGGLVIFLSFLF